MASQTALFFLPARLRQLTSGMWMDFFFLLVPLELKGCSLLLADVTAERLLCGVRGRPRSCVLRINSIKIIRTVCILLENSVVGSQRLFSHRLIRLLPCQGRLDNLWEPFTSVFTEEPSEIQAVFAQEFGR